MRVSREKEMKRQAKEEMKKFISIHRDYQPTEEDIRRDMEFLLIDEELADKDLY